MQRRKPALRHEATIIRIELAKNKPITWPGYRDTVFDVRDGRAESGRFSLTKATRLSARLPVLSIDHEGISRRPAPTASSPIKISPWSKSQRGSNLAGRSEQQRKKREETLVAATESGNTLRRSKSVVEDERLSRRYRNRASTGIR